MDKSNQLCKLIIVRSPIVNKYIFRARENDEELIDPKVSYFSSIEETNVPY